MLGRKKAWRLCWFSILRQADFVLGQKTGVIKSSLKQNLRKLWQVPKKMGCPRCEWSGQPGPRERLPQRTTGSGLQLFTSVNWVSSMSGARAKAEWPKQNPQGNDDSQTCSCVSLYGRLTVQPATTLLHLVHHMVLGRWWHPQGPPCSPTSGPGARTPWLTQGMQEAMLVSWCAFLPLIPLVHTILPFFTWTRVCLLFCSDISSMS